jgi:hypothetical protein
VFNYNGNYCTAKKRLIDQANKAFHALYYKLRNSTIPIDLQLKLFDSLIAPILVYSCEIWGFENKQGIEKLHLQFLIKILNLRNNTPNYMVYGEMGRFPMDIVIKLRMVMFWNERICRFCQVHIGNEFHFLLVCTHSQITALRHKYVPIYYTVNPSQNKMIDMLSYCNVMLYRNFCYFIKNIMRVLDAM